MKKVVIISLIILVVIITIFIVSKTSLLNNVAVATVPDTFEREDEFGSTTWSKIGNKYYYTLNYGMIAGIEQGTTLKSFMEAYKS